MNQTLENLLTASLVLITLGAAMYVFYEIINALFAIAVG